MSPEKPKGELFKFESDVKRNNLAEMEFILYLATLRSEKLTNHKKKKLS